MDEMLRGLMEASQALEQALQHEDSSSLQNHHSLNASSHQLTPTTTSIFSSTFTFLDRINESFYIEQLDQKINNIKMNSVSSRRKDELFKRYRKEQEEKIVHRRKDLQAKYFFNEAQIKEAGEFTLKQGDKKQIFTIKAEDLEKLRPETDLNDTIIDNYLKIVRLGILDQEIESKTHIFSSFFMGKLLGDLRDDLPPEKETEQIIEKIQKKVTDSYASVKRWTKKIDIFQKEYLVIPISAYKHWNCLIIVSPNEILTQPSLCKILYLDSMIEKRNIFPAAIKKYLELELQERKSQTIYLDQIETYQLLVPRQTNTHDCGLYTLCYIEHLLTKHQILDLDFEDIENRIQLKIFPRSIVFTMRECLRRLFIGLLKNENKEEVIAEYLKLREEILGSSQEVDYDEINEREFKKYYRINSQLVEEKKKKESQVEYQCKIKFYLDCEINHYEKDRGV